SPVARQTRRVCRRVVPLSLVARIAWPSAPPADPKKYSPKQRAGCGVSNMAAEQTSPEVASTLLRVKGLRKFYEQRRWLSRRRFVVPAVDGVDLAIARGTTLALVGESGSGKSTLARCLIRLVEPTAGEIRLDDRSLIGLPQADLSRIYRRGQMVFQDPTPAFKPRRPLRHAPGRPAPPPPTLA